MLRSLLGTYWVYISNTHLLVGRLLLPAELGAIASGMLEILMNEKHAD